MPDDEQPVQFDALDDYATCKRCGTLRPADELWCPRCRRIAMLTVERFGVTAEDERP